MRDPLIVTQADRALLGALLPHPELQRELDRAVMVLPEAVPPDVVTMNSRVAFRDETSDVRRVVTIVFPGDTDASAGRLSVLSPIGTALLGLSVGRRLTGTSRTAVAEGCGSRSLSNSRSSGCPGNRIFE
jgi:regulator of nucleoside diphosphate kinase